MSLAATWIVARMRLTLRNPRAFVFTIAFPLLLVVLFSGLNGNADVDTYGTTVRFAQFYTPAIAVFSLVTACYTTLVLGLANARDEGLLKRVRGTPLPMSIYLGAWVIGAMAVGIGAILLLFVVAVPAFDVKIYWDSLPAAVVTLLLGAACLAALGVAVATLVKSADQATPVVQLTFLPLSFISGIWFPLDGAPGWLVSIAEAFPLYHLAQAFGGAFTPAGGWEPGHLAVMALWTVGALVVAARRFRLES
ncbi:MAG TPA: ABC transporter permease [Solirubrobacter sp.]|jgi:ABC-2 type transport system permease protein|nr:ABC transporter permease [Solirubrobacter sp.]